MTYPAIIAGLHTVIETVAGLKLVLDYVPRSIVTTPMLYSEHVSSQYDDASDAMQAEFVTRHRTKHRLVLSWQDNEQCELELAGFIDAIPAAVKANPKLGGALADGWARVTAGESGWVAAEGGPLIYRFCDFYSEVWEV